MHARIECANLRSIGQQSDGSETPEEQRQRAIAELRRRAAAAERAHQEFHEEVRGPYQQIVTRQGVTVWRPREYVSLEEWRAAVASAYPPGFWSTLGRRMEALDQGEPAAVELAVLFLEADGWFHRSGYVKEKLLRRLARLSLDTDIKARLQHVVLNAVDGRDRREFRRFCRLGCKLDTPSLRAALRDRCSSNDPGVRRRAEWMLAAVERRPVSPELIAAQTSWYQVELAYTEAQRQRPPRGTQPWQVKLPHRPRHLRYDYGQPRRRTIRRELRERVRRAQQEREHQSGEIPP